MFTNDMRVEFFISERNKFFERKKIKITVNLGLPYQILL